MLLCFQSRPHRFHKRCALSRDFDDALYVPKSERVWHGVQGAAHNLSLSRHSTEYVDSPKAEEILNDDGIFTKASGAAFIKTTLVTIVGHQFVIHLRTHFVAVFEQIIDVGIEVVQVPAKALHVV